MIAAPADNKWSVVKLGDHVDLLTGYPFKSAKFTDSNHDMPLVRGANIMQGYLKWDGVKRWPSEEAKEYSKYLLEPGDVVLAMDRPWIEAGLKQACISERDLPCLLVQRVARLRGRNGLLTSFLNYLIASPSYTDYIRPIVTGVNVPHISGSQIQSFEFRLPPLSTQRKIASVLSAYDDLIENNTRRIEILEEMAQVIYREWFVNYRFPGHEKVEMVESELGPIPEGWELEPVGEAVETVGGGTPSTKMSEYWDNEVVWYSPTDLTASGTMFIGNSSKKISELGLRKSSARLFPPYSLMMTSRATIGVTAINTVPACTNQGFITCVPNDRVSAYQLYFWVEDNKDRIVTLASGATFKEINKTTFRGLPILVADEGTNRRFVETIEPLGKQIENLQNKNNNLRRTRDLLLPKLVSGEVDVAQVDTEIIQRDFA